MAPQTDKNILDGIQYYHECKAAAQSQVDDQDEINNSDNQWRVANCADEDSNVKVEPKEKDLWALRTGRMKNVFGEEQLDWAFCTTDQISIAHGADYMKLRNWQAAIAEGIVDLSRDPGVDEDEGGDAGVSTIMQEDINDVASKDAG
ncbi:hypothetical protein PAXRUDRAFT_16278 [Paxillus rubicundulus Ve08.2h10]|uniref:Uncharacterized protein n=1 Tax=Paxillus rubicundulus Ve08.2h10 TaxID=930991 RepID=A0A0D0D799_9AGAM|nr:hypothetical protein PAXRUDRAFT_16278 [Paxillus rubicundulus Ve08.2h10]